MQNRSLIVAVSMLLIAGCTLELEPTSPEELEAKKAAAALTGEPVTSSVLITHVCSASQAGRILYDVTAPAEVEPGETFQVTLHASHDLAVTVTPYAGVVNSSANISATAATPAALAPAFPETPFAMGDRILDFGETTIELTAATNGGPIELRVDQLNYSLTRAGQTTPGLSFQCPAAPDQPLLASIAIAGDAPESNAPTHPRQCRRFQSFTDDEGHAFASRRACMRYVLTHR